jgi:ketosteroid isomerase-like protein
MSVYVIARSKGQGEMLASERAGLPGPGAAAGARYLVRNRAVSGPAGDLDGQRITVVEFDDSEQAHGWYRGAENLAGLEVALVEGDASGGRPGPGANGLGYDPDRFAAEFLAPWNAHDVDAAVGAFIEDGEWEFTVGSDPWGTVHRGHPALRKAITAVFEAVPDIHYELVRQHAAPGHTTMEVLVTGTRAGERLNYHACDIVTFAGEGKIRGKRSFRKVIA